MEVKQKTDLSIPDRANQCLEKHLNIKSRCVRLGLELQTCKTVHSHEQGWAILFSILMLSILLSLGDLAIVVLACTVSSY